MVKTKSVNDPVDESEGTKILVTRYPVRFKKHKAFNTYFLGNLDSYMEPYQHCEPVSDYVPKGWL